MKVEFSYTFKLPRNLVWKYLQDEDTLRTSLPGCKSFEQMPNGAYQAEMGLNVGPVKGMFLSEVQQINQKPPSSYTLIIKGKGKPGEMDAVADMYIEELDGKSKLTCKADVEMRGLLGGLGNGVSRGVAKMIIGQFFKSAEKEMLKQTTR